MTGRRLITQNMLAAAAQIESGKRVTWSDIRDFVALADLFCLYDRVEIIGRQAYSFYSAKKYLFLDIIDDEKFVEVKEFENATNIVSAANAHLTNFLGINAKKRDFSDLIQDTLTPISIERVLKAEESYRDGPDIFEAGVRWLKKAQSTRNLVNALNKHPQHHRNVTFAVRTFLYTAYADVNELPFTPDLIRSSFLNKVIQSENKIWKKLTVAMQAHGIRKDIANSLQRSFEKRSADSSFGIARKVSPLAAIAFDRAKKDRREVFPQLLRLRSELKKVRARIRELELTILYGIGRSEVRARQKWQRAIQEIEAEFGPGKGSVRFDSAPAFGEAISDAIDHPESPASWVLGFGQIAARPIAKFARRRAVFQLIRMSKAMPNSGQLRKSMDSLFQKVEDS